MPVQNQKQLHPTAEQLIATALNLLDAKPVDQITVEEVLGLSGVARSSLYHHFDDFSHLMEYALIRQFSNQTFNAIAELTDMAEGTDSFEKARAASHQLSHKMQDTERRAQRMLRVVAIATADRNERFRSMLGEEQQRITDGYAFVIQLGQERGWMNPKLSPLFLATFLQAYTVGRVINDITNNPISAEEWQSGIDLLQDTFFLNAELTKAFTEH